jgi:RNA polymerase sigma-70 factor (ECF subfamily)
LAFITNISTQHFTDTELVVAYKKSNDLKHVSTLYQRYMDLVFGVCQKYLKDPEKSKDAVMEIYEHLTLKLKKHEVENFKGWLHVLTRNHCLMQLRVEKKYATTEFNADFMQSVVQNHLVNEALEKEENFKQLEDCLSTLPEEQRQSIELFFLQEKCYNEIAAITGKDWNKVRSFIQNGKRNLKICIEEKQEKII